MLSPPGQWAGASWAVHVEGPVRQEKATGAQSLGADRAAGTAAAPLTTPERELLPRDVNKCALWRQGL